MSRMVRKQFYIQKRQQALLKRLARMRGVSEAEIVREAIDRQIGGRAPRRHAPDPDALEEACRFMRARRAAASGTPYRWKRDEAYAERLEHLERRRQG